MQRVQGMTAGGMQRRSDPAGSPRSWRRLALGTVSFEGRRRRRGIRGGEQGAQNVRHLIHHLLRGRVVEVVNNGPIRGGASSLPRQTRGVTREAALGKVAMRGGGGEAPGKATTNQTRGARRKVKA